MAYFHRMTTTTKDSRKRNAMIMGRLTWESFPATPGPERISIVLTKSSLITPYEHVHAFKSLLEAIEALQESAEFKNQIEDVWVIGGAEVYKAALNSDCFHRLYLTKIFRNFDCTVNFPTLPKGLKEVRFGSGLGTAGAFPIVFSYLAETCSRSSRAKYVGLLHAMWPLGAAYTAIIFETTMPTLGEDIVRDNREHWSSWHRFLLLSILPTLGCIVGLMWTSESPRYLLEASREVEALAVYQRLHKLNQTRTQYGLTELELPGRNAYPERPSSPSRNMFAQSLDSIWQAFQKVSSPMYYRTTVLLAALHLICGFVHMGMSTFSMSMMKEVRENQYLAGKKLVENQRFSGHFNTTLENMYFKDCRFENATFTHMNLVHVNFWNCTIEDSQFFNVKASVFSIENSTVSNSKFVDTDLTDHHFINCVLINNTFLSLISNCVVDFDYNIYLDDLRIQNIIGPVVMTPVLFLIGVSLGSCFPSRSHMSVILWALICQTSLGILALTYDLAIFETITLSLQVQLNAVLNVITLLVLETYPCHIRCSAHGLMRSLFHVASLCAIPIYNSLTSTALIFPALTTATPCFLAAVLSLKLEDNSKVLM